MKIAYLANSTIPSREANSVHVMKMCAAFSALGHDITLIVPMNEGIDIEGDVYSFYGVPETFDIVRVPMVQIPKLGITWFGIRAAMTARYIGVDLVYGRSLVGCYFATYFGCPVMYETHLPRTTQGLAGTLFGHLLRRPQLERFVVISEKLRQYYAARFDHVVDRIVVAHDGADAVIPSAENVTLARNPSPDMLDVGYVGQLYQGKGMEIIAEIAPGCSSVQFHVVGGDPEDVDYWKSKCNDAENVTMYGFEPHSRALQYLKEFQVVLAPYQKRVEGTGGNKDLSRWMSPLKLFEYMAAGKAIVCSDLPVLREILTDEETVLFVDPGDPDAWIDALKRLQEDETLRKELGEAAQKTLKTQYTWVRRAERILNELAIGQ